MRTAKEIIEDHIRKLESELEIQQHEREITALELTRTINAIDRMEREIYDLREFLNSIEEKPNN